MYDVKWIRENAAEFDKGLQRRGLEPLSVQILKLDDERKSIIHELQVAQERRNSASKEIGQAMAAKDMSKADSLKAEVAALKDVMAQAEPKQARIAKELHELLSAIPNTPKSDVPKGSDEQGNVLKSEYGIKPQIAAPKHHYELGEALGMLDFEAASRMSGARFVVIKGQLARLERAIGQFMLDLHTSEHGYIEVNPPLLVRGDAMFGTAQLPKFADDQFAAGGIEFWEGSAEVWKNFSKEGEPAQFGTPFWLIPTAEVPLTNLVREQILAESELPLRFTALTPCFRAEAGSAGRDTRGMLRQHQFNKVELVSITTPEQSSDEHERMLACAEKVLQKLKLCYQVKTLCTGDMGFASQKTYDIEVWMPGQDTYREISSCSVCGDFQAQRMKTRFKNKAGKNEFVHTLNGSGVAVGRALIAVMENYQDADGSITVPNVLLPYMGGITTISKVV
jgi:seryl-tRNA synthetase